MTDSVKLPALRLIRGMRLSVYRVRGRFAASGGAPLDTLWASETRVIALGRLVLAAAGLVVIYHVPTEPDRFVPVTYAALVAYTAFSGCVYVLQMRGREFPFLQAWGHWIDIACYTLLITLSSGTNSIFFFGYF